MAIAVVPLALAVGAAAMASDPGPIDPIDDGTFPYLSLTRPFVDLTNTHIADTYPHHAALDSAHQTIAAASDATVFDRDAGRAVDEADGAHAAHAYAFENADPSEVTAATGAQGATIDGHRGSYDETPPDEVTVPDPGPLPSDGGGTPPPEI